MTTDQKGAIAEAAIALAATKLHIDVYQPMAEGRRCDLILGVGNDLLRVQCKWASLVNESVIVAARPFGALETATGLRRTRPTR